MGREPKSGDFSWLPAHSILNWIGGDVFILAPVMGKSRDSSKKLTEILKPWEIFPSTPKPWQNPGIASLTQAP